MKHKNRILVSISVLLCIVLLPFNVFAISVNNVISAQKALTQAESTKTKENIETAINTIFTVRVSNFTVQQEYTKEADIIEDIRTLIKSTNDSTSYIYKMLNLIEDDILNYKEAFYLDSMEELITDLPYGDIRTNYATKFNELNNEMYDNYKNNSETPNLNAINPNNNGNTALYVTGAKPVTKSSESSNNVSNHQNVYNQSVTYSYQNEICYKIIKNNDTGTTNKTVATESEQQFCGIYSNNVSAPATGYNYTSSATNNAAISSSYYTIQFSINKTDKIPVYVDTGIVTTENTSISYDQLKKLMSKITSAANGKFIEDSNKSMSFINGKIAILYNGNIGMTFKNFQSTINQFSNVEIKLVDKK